ncbi:MAG: methionyl-tRNA formyltransferase [Actinomyces sp.]|uniref:methionyl-tRNA formyltransferase n=1 Tax=Actinomyces sp. TaxID=29317 RepID=UPI0026DC6139|nr:methionyl-tRNA formyltransferase [Actinomyces sp.]MDO4243280.1 methionyl-tRNA formyltransferase [Actinomyces sp.]
MRVLFAGTPEVALPALNALVAAPEHEVVGVLTRADARQGRGRALRPSPVAARARQEGLEVRTPATLRDEAVAAWVRDLHVDVAVVVAYGRIVPPALLDVPGHGWLNLHFSVLPAWRGAAPVQHALIAGDDVTGACVFRLEEGLDTGDVYARLTETIRPTDTAGDLLERLSHAGAPMILDVLEALEAGAIVPEPQDGSLATMAPVLRPSDGVIDWTDPAPAIERRIRGVTPAPGARTWLGATDLRLGPVEVVANGPGLAPGELQVAKREVLVGTGGGAVRLGRLAPAGRSWMEAEAWARGARPPQGAHLGGPRPGDG